LFDGKEKSEAEKKTEGVDEGMAEEEGSI